MKKNKLVCLSLVSQVWVSRVHHHNANAVRNIKLIEHRRSPRKAPWGTCYIPTPHAVLQRHLWTGRLITSVYNSIGGGVQYSVIQHSNHTVCFLQGKGRGKQTHICHSGAFRTLSNSYGQAGWSSLKDHEISTDDLPMCEADGSMLTRPLSP